MKKYLFTTCPFDAVGNQFFIGFIEQEYMRSNNFKFICKMPVSLDWPLPLKAIWNVNMETMLSIEGQKKLCLPETVMFKCSTTGCIALKSWWLFELCINYYISLLLSRLYAQTFPSVIRANKAESCKQSRDGAEWNLGDEWPRRKPFCWGAPESIIQQIQVKIISIVMSLMITVFPVTVSTYVKYTTDAFKKFFICIQFYLAIVNYDSIL